MKVYQSPSHAQHAPAYEIFDGGEKIPNFETPQRVEYILAALGKDSRYSLLPPQDFGVEPILAVHDPGYFHFLQTAYAEWLSIDLDADYPKEALLPATFPPLNQRSQIPRTLLGRAGYYISDLSAPITTGTFPAALASAQCALSAAAEVAAQKQNAAALCRPPGHHAGRANASGYCYLNNAAIAAHWLTQYGKVAVLDIDYHAGNGTQEIFYERADVLTLSIHADPAEEYPYYSGYPQQTGINAGAGFHQNYPLPFGTDDAAYLATLEQALERLRAYQPAHLILSAGMDIYGADPLGKIRVTRQGIASIGERIASLRLPTAILLEGGYATAALGENFAALLNAFAA